MYTQLSDPQITMLIAMFSLVWFIVGVLAGQRLPAGRPRKKRSRAPRSRGSSDNGRVEMYVGNLSYDISEQDLMKEFRNYGKVLSVRIIKNKFNGKSKGFGFIEMAGRSPSAAAVKAMNGKSLKGRKIVVNEAKSAAARD